MKLNGCEVLSKRKARENTKYETFSQTFKIYAETIIVEDFILLGSMGTYFFYLVVIYLFIGCTKIHFYIFQAFILWRQRMRYPESYHSFPN